jgi:hypothetical protein
MISRSSEIRDDFGLPEMARDDSGTLFAPIFVPQSWSSVCSNCRLPAVGACTFSPALAAHQIALNSRTCRLADAAQSCVGVMQEGFAPVDHGMIHCLLHLVFSSPSYPCFPDLFRPCCRLCLFPITAQINLSICFRFFFFVSIREFSLDLTGLWNSRSRSEGGS